MSIRVGDIDVHIEGTGPQVLLMIHGWPDTYRVWDAQAAYFSAHYRCVRFTLPGYDDRTSHQAYSVDQIARLIDQVVDAVSPNQPVVLMIHDWGAVFGYEFYRQHPNKVAQMVSLDIGDALSSAHLKSLKPHQLALLASYQLSLAVSWQLPESVATRITRGFAKLLQHTNPKQAHRGMNYPYFLAWFKRLSQPLKPFSETPNCPMFFIYAKRKPLMFHSDAWVARLQAVPHHRVLGMPTGHWIMQDQPEQFNEVVWAWLTQTQTNSASL